MNFGGYNSASPPSLYPTPKERNHWNPGTAAVLSLFIPGAGQMYKGQIGLGLAWLIGAAIGYMALLAPGVIVHVACIFNAYNGDPRS